MKKQLIHSRPLLFIFLAFGLGIYFARPIYTFDFLVITFFVIAFLFVIFLCVKYKHFKRAFLITLCLSIGILYSLLTNIFYVNTHYVSNHIVTGRVAVCTQYESSCVFMIDNVLIDNKESNGNIIVYFYSSQNIEMGDTVSFLSNLKDVSLYNLKQFNNYFYNNNIKYTCTIKNDDLSIIKSNSLTWAESIRLSVKNLLQNNMNKDEASVCFASLFGDKSNISQNIRENFSISAQAHLLAVSGLHIGFLVAFLSKILSKLKTKKYVNVLIILSFLGFYCYLCSWASSVIRASIMFFILCLGGLLGKQYDRLNAWSIAGIFVLAIRPMYVYDLGFLLSFACILCIIIFSNSVKRLLKRLKLPNFLASPLSVAVPVQLGLIPLLAIGFSKISLLGILASVLTVPFFEVFFIMLFVFTIICLIMPFISFVLKLPMLFIHILMLVVETIAKLDFAIITLTRITGIFVVGFYASFFIYSNIINADKTTKLSYIAGLLAVVFILSGIITQKVEVTGNSFAVISSYGKNAYYVELDKTSYMIGDFNFEQIKQSKAFLNSTHIYNVDYYISFTKNVVSDDIYFYNAYNLDNLSMLDSQNNNVKIIRLNNKIAGIILQNDKKCIFFCKNQLFNDGLCMDFASDYSEINLIVGYKMYVEQYTKYLNCLALVDGKYYIENSGNYIFDGNYSFDYDGTKISNVRSLD